MGPKRLSFWQALQLIIIAVCILDTMRMAIEEDALQCNRLIAKPVWAGFLTCQKTYHYQPDPFTG
jgi:hypothetical protein